MFCGVYKYILMEIHKLQIAVGLCRDDGLAVTSASPRQVKILKKPLSAIFIKLLSFLWYEV